LVRLFKQYIPVSLVYLALVELVLLFFCFYGGVVFHSAIESDFSVTSIAPLYPKAITFALVHFLSIGSMGLYQRRFRLGIAGILLRLSAAFCMGAIAMSFIYYALPTQSVERLTQAASFVVAFSTITLVRVLFMKTVDQNLLKRRVLVLGAGEYAGQIQNNLRRTTDQRGFLVVGYVHVRGEHDVVNEALILRPEQPLVTICSQLQIDEIVVAVGDRRRKSFPVHELLDCKLSGVDVIDLTQFFEREVGKIKLDIVNPSWLIFSEGFSQGEYQAFFKRAFDVLMSLLLLAVTWPAMVLVAIAIFVESGFRGPILFKQVRVGQHWQLFHVLKFRSMRVDAEKDGAQWAQKNDNRVTRVGSFIRKVRLDELPQIFNVLMGDMSFVGPRPERPEFVTELSNQIPYYAERHRVKPGITGWAQVCYPYGASEKDALEKLQFDLYYIKNYTLFLDLVIILQTAHEVTWGKGAR